MGVKGSADSEKISIRSWILAMGWKEWGIVLLLGILLLVAGLPVTQKSNKSINTQAAEKTRLESRLEELLSNVEGVGKVEVIIMTGEERNTDSFSISSKVQNIQQAIMALFQIDAHKIRVMKMK